jgi:hypothetical protein
MQTRHTLRQGTHMCQDKCPAGVGRCLKTFRQVLFASIGPGRVPGLRKATRANDHLVWCFGQGRGARKNEGYWAQHVAPKKTDLFQRL